MLHVTTRDVCGGGELGQLTGTVAQSLTCIAIFGFLSYTSTASRITLRSHTFTQPAIISPTALLSVRQSLLLHTPPSERNHASLHDHA